MGTFIVCYGYVCQISSNYVDLVIIYVDDIQF